MALRSLSVDTSVRWLLLLGCLGLVAWIRLLPLSLPIVDEQAEGNVRRRIGQRLTQEYASTQATPFSPDDLRQAVDEWIAQHPDQFANEKTQLAGRMKARLRYHGDDGKEYVYLGDLDSYVWLRNARNYLRTGTTCDAVTDDVCLDTYTHAPVGGVMQYNRSLHIVSIVALHQFITFFSPSYPLPASAFLVPVVIGLLGVLPAFFLGRAVGSNIGGVFAAETGRSVLLRAHEPYGYTDRHPEAYQALRTVSPYRNFRPVGPIRICIHVRRGDRILAQDPRLLPNAYYLRVCGTVVNALQQQRVSFVVRLHTEMPQQPHTVHPDHAGLFIHLDKPSTLDPVAHALTDFEALPNLEKVLNVGSREALDDFATADVLILSLSSFGYMGGLLNPHGLVIAGPKLPRPRNFHTALPDWLVADEHGDVNATQVATRIASQLRRRG